MEGLKETENGTSGKALCPLVESYKYILSPLTYSSVFVLGLLLHGATLRPSCCRAEGWTCTTIYLVNPAVADLLYLFSLPLLVVNYSLRDAWPFGEPLCKLVRFLFYANLYGSVLLLTGISVHRFLGVCYPIRSLPYRARRLAAAGTATAWAPVFLQLLPTLTYARTGGINNRTACYDTASPENLGSYFPYGTALTAAGFLLPFLIILACSGLMIRSLTRHAGDTHPTGSAARAKSTRTILLVCGLFAVCLLPFHTTRSIYLFVRVYRVADCQLLQRWSLLYKIWRPLVSLNSCINPLLYSLSGQTNRARLALELRLPKAGPLARPAMDTEGTDAPARLAPC